MNFPARLMPAARCCFALLTALAAYTPAAAQAPEREKILQAEAGDTQAQTALGEMYRDGRGVKKDEAVAVTWLRRAAEAGDAGAQMDLGQMYRHGRGVPADPVEAHKWMILGAERVQGLARVKDYAALRDAHAAELAPAQKTEAQNRAGTWMDRCRPVSEPDAVRVGGAIKEPRKIKHASPVYPDAALQARVQGVVIMEITIDTEGKVVQLEVLRGIPLLDQAAIDAVKQWVYTPTLLNGVPVPVIMTVTVNFRLS